MKPLTIVKYAPRRTRIAQDKSKRLTKAKLPSLTKLKKKADSLMSLYVRQKHADDDGMVTCYTCPYSAHWKKMQNGHLVSRYYMQTRYDLRNTRPQCFTCNMYRNGMTPHFAVNLQQELGVGIVDELYEKARITRIYARDFYEEQISIFEELLKTLPTYQEKV